jgi:hypothetical protein
MRRYLSRLEPEAGEQQEPSGNMQLSKKARYEETLLSAETRLTNMLSHFE